MYHHGTRDPRNILLEQDYCPHESHEDTQPYNKFSASPHGRSCGQDACNIPTPQSYCSRENIITPEGYNRGNEPPFKDLHDSRTTTKMCTHFPGENSPAKKSYHSCNSHIGCKDSPLGESGAGESYATPNYMTSKKALPLNFKSIRPTEYGEQFLQPQLKDLPEARGYVQQFRNGIVNDCNGQQFEHHGRKTGPAAAPAINDSPYQDSGAASLHEKPIGACKGGDETATKCARDKPRGTPFSCNECKEPQCLYCWRKLQDPNGADFSFLDGFDTHEPTWKPGRKNVDLFGQYLKPNHGSLKRGTRVGDNLQACNQIRKEELSACQSSYAQQEEPKWKPAHRINETHDHQNGGSISGKVECSSTSSRRGAQISSQFKEIEWPLGKGRGIGPVPGEWVPPFRKYAEDYPYNERNRGKGIGATPNLEDWVPPFRDEKLQQGHSWHRCKGIGECPPRDQWLAPWRHPKHDMRPNEICSGR